MDLNAARQHIQSHFERMRVLYAKPVFDEWVILGLGPKSGILDYHGPRAENARAQLTDDVEPLRAIAAGRQFAVGDFDFALEASGPHYDALIKTGPNSYLVCNNTGKTMKEIRSDARWLKAQAVFFELGEKFRSDPLAV
jgi:hypothetical protein